jgi:hypothetical protein
MHVFSGHYRARERAGTRARPYISTFHLVSLRTYETRRIFSIRCHLLEL